MSSNSSSVLSLRIRFEQRYVRGCVPLSVHISLKCDEGGAAEASTEYIEDDMSGCGDDIVVNLRQSSPSMQSLLREERRFLHAVASGVVRNISIDDMADACCLSVSTFKRRFRTRYSTSPHRWLLSQRLRIAHTLILTTTLSITDLAAVCGFRNASHFIAQFRRRYSTTPMHLRDTSASSKDCDGDIVIEIEL